MLTNECVTKEGPLKKSHTIHILTIYVTFFFAYMVLTWCLLPLHIGHGVLCMPLRIGYRVSDQSTCTYPTRHAGPHIPRHLIDTHNNNHYIYIYNYIYHSKKKPFIYNYNILYSIIIFTSNFMFCATQNFVFLNLK